MQIVSYAWDFGDGTTSTSQNPSHVFSNSGDVPAYYNVSLTVTDDSGNTNTRIYPIVVFNPQSIARIAWDFGDGGSSTSTAPVHQYFNSGSTPLYYTVHMDCEDGYGMVNSRSFGPIVVYPEHPIACVWNFGDGEESSDYETVQTHYYWIPGKFDVSLRLTGMYGDDQTIEIDYITVYGVGISASPVTGKAPLAVKFTPVSLLPS